MSRSMSLARQASTRLFNRRDFGLTWDGPPLEAGRFIVGDDVTISLSIQGIAQ
jgi:hypothetical protein